MNNYKIILSSVIAALALSACGGDTTPTEPTNPDNPTISRCPAGTPNIILDNDNFDPDWLPTLIGAINMDQNCEINLLGVIVNGTNTYQKAGIMYSTVLSYYDIQDRVPLGVVNDRPQRTTPTKATSDNPPKDGAYKGTHSNITEFPSDELLDNNRPGAAEVICEILENANGKVDYVTGGHLTGLQAFLEGNHCDAISLTKSKINKFVFGTGYDDRHEGTAEMNFSEGRYNVETAASKSANYVMNKLNAEASDVQIHLPSDHWNWDDAKVYRMGDQYKEDKHLDSPMSFVYSIYTYGVWGDHGAGDSLAVLYSSGITKVAGVQTGTRQVCITLNPVDARINIKDSTDCNHWVGTYNSNVGGYVGQKITQAIESPTASGKI